MTVLIREMDISEISGQMTHENYPNLLAMN